MRIFLAGAGGFIGGAVREALEQAGHGVFAHVRSGSGDLDASSIPDGFDVAINAAGRLGAPGIPGTELEASNTKLPVIIGEACASRDLPLVHLSTPGVAGLAGGSREDSPLAPWGPYEASKAAAESLLSEIMPAGRLTILRPDFVYGPGDRHKLGLFRQVRKGWFPLVGSGRAMMRPTFVRDAVRAVLESLPGGVLGPGTWNIGGPEVVSAKELASSTAEALGSEVLLIRVPRFVYELALALGPLAPGQVSRSRFELFGRDHWVDVSKASEAGFISRTGLAAGLRETVGWYRSEGLIR